MSIGALMFSCERMFTCLRVRLGRGLLAGLVLIAAGQQADAQVQAEAPWHAVAYSYLNTLFLLNLDPVDWPLIEEVLTTDHDGRILGRPASDRLVELDQAAGTAHWQAIETALAAESAPTLHAAITRAMSAAIRQHLANAAAALEQSGLAGAEIDQAQALFRAFADGIKQTDPEGFRALGLAWLELASSVRQSGAIAAGGLPADREAFSSAQTLLVSYLIRNFEPDIFASRDIYAPIPEERIIADPYIRMTPWLPPGSDIRNQDPLPASGAERRRAGGGRAGPLFGGVRRHAVRQPRDLRRSRKKPRHRLLHLPQSKRHQPALLHHRASRPSIQAWSTSTARFFNPRFNDHRADRRSTSRACAGIRFTGPYGRDGRFGSVCVTSPAM